MKKLLKKEKLFWIILMLLIFVAIETSSYLSTGNFYMCGRFGNCSEVDFWTLLGIIIFFVVTSVVLNYFDRKNLFKGRVGISTSAANWYQFVTNIIFMLVTASVIIFMIKVMETTNYVTSHLQPLLGLVMGTIIVLLSAYMHWKIDKKVKAEATLRLTSRSMSNPMWRTILTFGIAFGGVMIIIAIKFLSS